MHAIATAALLDAIATRWEAPDLIFFKLLGVLLIVAVNGFFVIAEFSIVKIRSSQLDTLIEKGDRRALFARHVTEHLDAYLSATQLGVTMASLALGWVGEPYVAHLIEPFFSLAGIHAPAVVNTIAVVLGFAAITFLHITLGELGPKYLAINDPLGVSLRVVRPLRIFYRDLPTGHLGAQPLVELHPAGPPADQSGQRSGTGPQRGRVAPHLRRERGGR